MLRRFIFAIAIAVVASGHANAQYSYVGSLVITAVQGPDCNSVSAQVSELHTAVYRPVQDGITTATLVILQPQSALQIRPNAGGSFAASGAYAGRLFTGRAGFVEPVGNYSGFLVKPAPSPTTKVIDISGKVTNFKNAGSCTVSLTGGFVLKPPAQ